MASVTLEYTLPELRAEFLVHQLLVTLAHSLIDTLDIAVDGKCAEVGIRRRFRRWFQRRSGLCHGPLALRRNRYSGLCWPLQVACDIRLVQQTIDLRRVIERMVRLERQVRRELEPQRVRNLPA